MLIGSATVMRFQVVWECIRPDVFVHEPGPEPPVVVRPMTIHKDMQALIGSGKFSDIKFRFQVRRAGHTCSRLCGHWLVSYLRRFAEPMGRADVWILMTLGAR